MIIILWGLPLTLLVSLPLLSLGFALFSPIVFSTISALSRQSFLPSELFCQYPLSVKLPCVSTLCYQCSCTSSSVTPDARLALTSFPSNSLWLSIGTQYGHIHISSSLLPVSSLSRRLYPSRQFFIPSVLYPCTSLSLYLSIVTSLSLPLYLFPVL